MKTLKTAMDLKLPGGKLAEVRVQTLRAVSVVPEMLAACMALVGAYEAVDPAAGESVDWNDVDRAFEFAKKAVKKLNL